MRFPDLLAHVARLEDECRDLQDQINSIWNAIDRSVSVPKGEMKPSAQFRRLPGERPLPALEEG